MPEGQAFVQFADLTEEIVLNWIKAVVVGGYEEHVNGIIAKQIEQKINPVTEAALPWAGTTENHYAEGWVSSVSAGTGDNNWRVYAATWNSSTDTASFFVNGARTAGPNSNASAGPNNFSIGAHAGAYEFSAGEFGGLYIYNRVLTDAEIRQMYISLRSKFEL